MKRKTLRERAEDRAIALFGDGLRGWLERNAYERGYKDGHRNARSERRRREK